MKNLIGSLIVLFATQASAYVVGDRAVLVSETEKDGVITRVYMQELYADAYEYCSQIITIKSLKATGEKLSSESKETCHRIR